MLYLNQLDYRHIPYNHNVNHGGVPEERRNCATSGCGLCSLCMVVDHLTTKHLDLEECVRLSEENGANHAIGTDMKILAPIVAKMFDLELNMTNSVEELVEHLRCGGEAIVHVSVREGRISLFTKGGHYMVILSTDGKEVCILDPSYTDTKFEEEGRREKVRVNAPFVYCSLEDIMIQTDNRDPGFYLFKRKVFPQGTVAQRPFRV